MWRFHSSDMRRLAAVQHVRYSSPLCRRPPGATVEARPRRCQVSDRVSERRRAAVLARHYREQESLTIAEIARRLGRAEATVKAYLYDPS
jgi:DNA-directed RNA polymerase specialized sigma24 family protein